MAGNSQRKGAMRKTSKKGSTVGSGGQRRQGLEGRGPTPKAADRKQHKTYKGDAKKTTRSSGTASATSVRSSRATKAQLDVVVGRNPVVEALRAKVPAIALHVATGIEQDERIREALDLASEQGLNILEVGKMQIERIAGVALHQGIALTVKPYTYPDAEEVIGTSKLIVALDGITDPRNLGAVVRSAAAFGAGAVVLPERRSTGMTAVAWRTSAGAAARVPVARATNLTRTIEKFKKAGYFVIGLDADGEQNISQAAKSLGKSKVLLVIGSEGKGLSRLVAENCDVIAFIPMTGETESLNASVAAGIALFTIAQVQ
ncbi:MAG: 23S rRNA (guanosine(2251)-2'-O)-methyltransferase RlmB [Actinobacteria bacterium]|nr:23S rRNA (guanosine(2251)-2'-O)-methyltransferase RlmB [Actinomycetota bacterium]